MGFPIPDTGEVTEDAGVVGGFLTTSGNAETGPLLNLGTFTPETITGSYGSQLVIESDGEWTYQADNSNASIQALDDGEELTEVFTVSSTLGDTTITITINGADEPPCFVAGTLIDTPMGPRPVEDLQPGDRVLTRDNGVQEVCWAGQRDLRLGDPAASAKLQPVRLRKDSLAPGVPSRDLWLSPMHRVLLRGPEVEILTGAREVLCPVGHLVNGQTILRESVAQVSYHHLLFRDHQVLRTSGCDSESFLPGTVGLNGFEDATREEVFALFPELRSLPETYGRAARHIARGYEADLLRDVLRPMQGFFARLAGHAA